MRYDENFINDTAVKCLSAADRDYAWLAALIFYVKSSKDAA